MKEWVTHRQRGSRRQTRCNRRRKAWRRDRTRRRTRPRRDRRFSWPPFRWARIFQRLWRSRRRATWGPTSWASSSFGGCYAPSFRRSPLARWIAWGTGPSASAAFPAAPPCSSPSSWTIPPGGSRFSACCNTSSSALLLLPSISLCVSVPSFLPSIWVFVPELSH